MDKRRCWTDEEEKLLFQNKGLTIYELCLLFPQKTKDQIRNKCKREKIKMGLARGFTYEDVKYFIEVESDSGCKLLSNNYINNKSKMLLLCNCGNKFEVNFMVFKNKNKRQCNECSGVIDWNTDKFRFYVENTSKSGCTIPLNSNEYKNLKTKMLFVCECGNKFYATPHQFLYMNKRQCNDCGKAIKLKKVTKTNEQFKQEVYDLVGNEYIFLEEYVNIRTKIKCRHEVCSNTYKVNPGLFLYSKSRCPKCIESKGEKEIRGHMTKNNIAYEIECTFDDLKGVGGIALRFDFAVSDNNRLLFLIEYDGEQHYRPVNFGGISDEEAQNNFDYQQQNDNIKNQYCKDNNISLLRIPYWEFDNIEKILKEWLDRYELYKDKKCLNKY